MTDSPLPMYRIIYADGFAGSPRTWPSVRRMWDWQLGLRLPRMLEPVRVERAR